MKAFALITFFITDRFLFLDKELRLERFFLSAPDDMSESHKN